MRWAKAGAIAAALVALTVDGRSAPRLAPAASINLAVRTLGGEVALVRRARGALERCFGPEDARPFAIEYTLRVGPNGAVAAVDLDRGPRSPGLDACLRAALAGVLFDPPVGGGALFAGALVVGAEPPPGAPVAPLAPRPRPPPWTQGPIPLPPVSLRPAAFAPEGRAVELALAAARRCFTGDAGHVEIRVRMHLGPRRTVAATSSHRALAACVERDVARAELGGAPADLDVTVVVDEGAIRVAR